MLEESASYNGGGSEPASPISQYLNSSVLSISILGVLEFEVPLDDLESQVIPLLSNVFLPLSPRFSSVMVTDANGRRKWKRVNVKLEDHFHIAEMSSASSPSENSEFLRDYLTRLGMESLPHNRPLWEIHAIKYPTTEAAATLIFKLHHSLGDGYSLMGALLSCLERADDPSRPLTFPSIMTTRTSLGGESRLKCLRAVPKVFPLVYNTIREFAVSILKSTCLEDDLSPVRSGEDGVEFRPFVIATTSFSLDAIKQVKSWLQVTINDVICGMVFLGIHLYMQKHGNGSAGNRAKSTALVLLSTRVLQEYKTVQEMARPGSKSPWGNHFSFLHVTVPKFTNYDADNPLKFVHYAHKLIKRKRTSLAVYLTGQLLQFIKKIRGPEAAAKYMRSTLENSSMTITNLIGPIEQMALSQHPVKGLYYMVAGVPQSLAISVLSYTGKVRIAISAEKDFIDSQKLTFCINDALTMISQAASP
ncbi:O-acyltransferase WSD1-like [Punica granatum]|uniref:Uncharacterized protein n=2 Tax=Punica granatum TaxID=22663 RepID=A0A218Y195_PUNGR|nr:O-acyltransferase WSD1-like [Punica granatum]OWM91053.1 hypothetical protein CDL15_Pgr023386 [Punica granatum]PKI51317.1 hypothetical protein CRG98_028264 [Punica granatum]